MNYSDITPSASKINFSSGLEVVSGSAEKINERFGSSIVRIEKMIENCLETGSLKNVNSPRFLLAGTCMTYAKHLASQGREEDAIEQIRKAQTIYDTIDFSKVADQSCSKAGFLNNCAQLIKKYQSGK